MANLTSQSLKDTYKDLIHVFDADSASQGFSASLKPLYDGAGNTGPFSLSATTLDIPVGNTLNVEGTFSGAGMVDLGLPSQSGHAGKFLTTNASTASWETIDTEITAVGTLTGATPLVFEGATANDFETTFAITDPTADRTLTFPNATGTVAMTSDIPTATSELTNDSSFVVNNPQGVHLNLQTEYLAGKKLQYNGTEVEVVGHTHSGYATSGTNADITSMTGLALTAFIIEGTANDYETSIKFVDPTADRNITFPDVTGTVITSGNLTAINGTLGASVISTGKLIAPEFQAWNGSLNYYSAMSYSAANLVKLGKTDTGSSIDHCDVLIDTGTTLLVKGTIVQSAIADPESPPGVVDGGFYFDGTNLYLGIE